MDITPKIDASTNIINSYSADHIFMNKIPYSKKLFLSPNSVFEHDIKDPDSLGVKDLSWIISEIEENNLQVESVVLIGYDCGTICSEIKQLLTRKSIGFDIMTSRAAYRTYNLLASEDRRVYAILF